MERSLLISIEDVGSAGESVWEVLIAAEEGSGDVAVTIWPTHIIFPKLSGLWHQFQSLICRFLKTWNLQNLRNVVWNGHHPMESLMTCLNAISNIHNIIRASMTTHNTLCNIPLAFQVQEWTSTPFLVRSWNPECPEYIPEYICWVILSLGHATLSIGPFPSLLWALCALESFPAPQVGPPTHSRSYFKVY